MESIVTNDDCMELMARYPDGYFSLAVVDPPYGIGAFERGLGGTRFDKHRSGNLSFNNNKPTERYFRELFRVSKNQVVWGANNFIMPPSEYFCIWNKKQTVDNFASAEYAWVSMGLKKPAKVFDYAIHKHNSTETKIHPTQKPIALYDWIYKNYLPDGGKVLDTHLGSGSNRIAADRAGNIDFIACELDKDYFEAQEKRFAEYKSQLKLF